MIPLILLGFMILMIMGSLFMTSMADNKKAYLPSLEKELAQKYKDIGQLTGISWSDMIVYDTVRYENDFSEVDPSETAFEFLIVQYSEYKLTEVCVARDEDGYCSAYELIKTLIREENLKSKEAILSKLCEILGYEYKEVRNWPIEKVIEMYDKIDDGGIPGIDEEKYSISFRGKDIEDVVRYFSEEQWEWTNTLIADYVVQIMFGEVYELPEFIVVDGNGYFAWPTPDLHEITSPYGWRIHPIYGTRKFHAGIDIAGSGAMGKPVIAAADGVVTLVVLEDRSDAGLNVRIRHIDEDSKEWQTRYCHLSQILVSEGDQVVRGQVIGAVGSTGASTGPHLHFEMKYMGQLIDPFPYIH